MSIRQFSITALVTLAVAIGTEAGLAQTSPAVPQVVRDRIAGEGRARVIVELATTSPRPVAGGRRSAEQIRERQAEIGAQRQRLRATLRAGNHRFIHEFANAPFVALEIDAHALAELESATSPAVRVFEDLLLAPALGASVPLIEADLAHELGLNGSGTVIAVIDTGVDATHAFLGPRLVAEACFASPESGSIGACPNGLSEQVGPGAAASCTFAAGTCGHGTHVAGIALGSGAEFSGVAPGAALMAIQVFHASTQCFGFESLPCARAYESDIVAALEHVYEQRSQHNIAAANLSLGGGAFASACDAQRPLLAAVIDNLKSVGIATVAASGNSGLTGAIGAPACIASAISVGATDDADEVAWFSSSSADLDLLAPGVDIESSIPGGGFAEQSGTSMAAPHVAGAWAVFKQAHPGVGVDEVLASFVITGTPIVDSRGGETKPRIRVGAAVGVELPAPLIHSISPETATAFGQDFLMTVVGAGFVGASKVHVNGIVQSTTYVDDTTLRALVRGMDLPTSGAPASVTVVTAPPGGGTSNAATLNVVLPAVHVDSTTIEAGEAVDVTIVNSTGGRDDWIALAPVGAPSTQYVLYAYARSVSPTWTVNMPETPGTYEFRLFLDDGFVQAAVSAPVTVVPLGPPTLTPSATSVAAGAPVTVTLAKGRGGSTDWVSLAAVGSAATSYVRYTYVSAGAKNWTWTVTAPETPGTYEFRLFLNNGYAQAAVSAPVTVVGSAPPPTPPEPPPTPPPTPAATLTPSATSVAAGGPVTVTLANSPGGSTDWLAFAAVGSGATSYVSYAYVGAGTKNRTWTVTAPQTPGTYEFRLFLNNGYVQAAVSAPVTVVGSAPPPTPPEPPPAPVATLTPSATSVAAGAPVTVTLANSPGGSTDWLAFSVVGSGATSYVSYAYVGAGTKNRTWTVTAPQTPGTYEFRLFLNNGYVQAAVSAPVTVVGSAPPPTPPEPPPAPVATLTPSATSVAAGAPVTVTLANSPGGSTDWLAFAAVGSGATSYVSYAYVGAGTKNRTWTVTAPQTPGTYEFRLFLNNGYVQAAVSVPVTVQ